MSDESIDNATSLDASSGPDNNIGPKVDKLPDNNIGPKVDKLPDNNIGPKVVSPLGAVSVSKAKGSSFPIQLTFSNVNPTTLDWTASVDKGWVKLSRTSGKGLAHNQQVTIDATVDVSTVSVGPQSFTLKVGFPSHMPGVAEKTTSTTITVKVDP